MRNVVRFRLDIVARVLIDSAVLALCTFCSLLAQFSFGSAHNSNALHDSLDHLGFSSLIVVPVGVVVFWAMGLYTTTRGYPILQKLVRITQAVAIVFAVVAAVHYLFAAGGVLPGKSLPVAGILLLAAIIGGRIWARFWSYLVLTDDITPNVLISKLREKNVLLIGGAGYIGSALLPQLLNDGYKVRLLDSFVYGEEPIAEWMSHRNLEVFRADFRQVDKVVEAMQGMGTVIHLGAIVGDPACALNEELTIEVNLVATRMVAEVAKGAGVSRFVFASTCSVYGVSNELLDEKSKLNPVSLYARSKIACEQVLLGLKDESFKPVVLRFGTIYGLSGRTRFDLVVNLLTARAFVDGSMSVYGSDQWRPFVHVEDAARAVLMATEADPADVGKMIFNVGSDEQNLTLGQVGSLIAAKVPTARLTFVNENVDRRNYRVNFRRIRESLGFLPMWSLSEGIDQVLNAIRSGAVHDYRISKYSNVIFLKEQGRDALKVQNGWAKDMIEGSWLGDSFIAEDRRFTASAGD